MAIPAPRIIFACSIPTIIVILTYIWYKKKRELQPGSVCGSSPSPSCSTNTDVVDEGTAENALYESVRIPFEEDSRETSSSSNSSLVIASSHEQPSSESQFVTFRDATPPFCADESLIVLTPSCSSTPEAKGAIRMVNRKDAEDGGETLESPPPKDGAAPSAAAKSEQPNVSCSKSCTLSSESSVGSNGEKAAEVDVTNGSSSSRSLSPEVQSKMAAASDGCGENAADFKCDLPNQNGSVNGTTTESSDAVSLQRQQHETCDLVRSFKKTLTVSQTDAPEGAPVPEKTMNDVSDTPIGAQLPEQAVISHAASTEGDLDKTLVNDAETSRASCTASPNDTIVSDKKDTSSSISACSDSPGTASRRAGDISDPPRRRGCSSTELDGEVAPTSVIAEPARTVSSPGSATDDQELQKLTNGTDTSAYGSASHSPAEELLESPVASSYSDMHSEGSSDSGKGCSDIHALSGDGPSMVLPFIPLSVFEFEIPQDLCGRLIGIKGRYVNFIKTKSRANISIKRHPFNTELKLCAVIGTEEDINGALLMIRKRFPIEKFPYISMIQVNAPLLNNVPIPDTLQLHLPEGVTCDVILSSLVNAGHFFVQQPTHPTYSSLGQLDHCMLHCYLSGAGVPELPKPVEPGVICAASTMGGWYRAQIVYVHPDTDECELRFVDYGGYSQAAISTLRQIRSDFMTLPFQASECYLGNVAAVDENQGWTLEATSIFEELAQGQILQAQIVAYSDDGIPYVHLYRIQGIMTTFINRELVTRGVAKWIEHTE